MTIPDIRSLFDEKTHFILTSPEICALKTACETQNKSLQAATEIISKEEVEKEVEILENTIQMAFKKHKAADVVFSLVIRAELKEIKECHGANDKLSCGHTAKEHMRALEIVLRQCGKFFSVH